jgi:hypothetical protein
MRERVSDCLRCKWSAEPWRMTLVKRHMEYAVAMMEYHDHTMEVNADKQNRLISTAANEGNFPSALHY